MRLSLSILFLLILAACDLIYEDNQRWLVTTVITDQYGQPVAELPVTMIASNYSDRDVIGLNVTNKNGLARVRSIAPSNASEYIVEVNMADQLGNRFDSAVSSLRLVAPLEDADIKNILTNDLTLDLGNMQVNRLAKFILRIENSSGTSDTLNWEITANQIHKEIDSNDFKPMNHSMVTKGRLLPNDPLQSYHLQVIDNDTLRLKYQFNNSAVTGSGQELIIMKSEDLTYVFEF